MPDETTQPAETTGATTQATTTDPTPETGKDGQPFDAARAQRTIEQQRSELKQLRTQAQEAETLRAKVTEFEREKLSETERLTAEVTDWKSKATDLESKYQTALIRAAVDREAGKQGAVDTDAVFALMDRSGLQIDDAGAVTGADKAVKSLLEAKPYLVGQTAGNGRATVAVPGTPRPAGSPSRDEITQRDIDSLRATGRYSV